MRNQFKSIKTFEKRYDQNSVKEGKNKFPFFENRKALSLLGCPLIAHGMFTEIWILGIVQ